MKSITKLVEFKIRANTWTWPSAVPSSIQQLSGVQSVDLLELALLIAFYTAPPQGYGFERSYQWAALRYLPAFDTSNEMVLRPEWDEVDAHQKTILSDDFGFGFGAYVAERCLGPGALLNTAYFLDLALRYKFGNFSYVKKSKRGPSKAPDFAHVRIRTPHVDLIECKGSQTSSYLETAETKGVAQKRNIKIDSSTSTHMKIGERLVVAVSISRQLSDPSYCTIRDPPQENPFPNLSHEEFLLLAARYDLARSTALMGLPSLSAFFWLGDEVMANASIEANQRRRYLRQRDIGRGSKEGTRTVIDLPRAIERPDLPLSSYKDEFVSLSLRAETLTSVMEQVSAGKSVNSIAESIVRDARQSLRPSRSPSDPEKIVESPFGSSLSVEIMSREERANLAPDEL